MDLTSLTGLGGEAALGFALTSALIEVTPGPNMAYLAIVGATEGRARGYAAVAGVALGLAIIGILAALGLAALIGRSDTLYTALRWTGVAYLFWLALDSWRGERGGELAAPGAHLGRYFGRGLITNLLNPKSAAFYVAVLPTFVDPRGDVLAQTLGLTAIYVAVATAIHAGIVTAAAGAGSLLASPAREQRLRRALSLALAGVAVWFAWKTAR